MASIRRTGRRREIAQRIRRRRLDLGISQEVAAKQLGVDRVIWSSIELGKQSVPAERLVDVARIVKATVDELLGVVQPQQEAA
jgi:transcriptional regulator with XRE-family HTH domain